MSRSVRLLRCLSLLPILFWSGYAANGGTNSVVNLSHYDEGRPDFLRMKREGIIGAIHEATFPRFNHDSAYSARQGAATRAGLLWGAYHFADATDPVRQADHFLRAVRAGGEGTSSSAVLLVLDFELNDHYPGGTMRVDQAVAFVERIHAKTGKYPGLYSNENRVKQVLNSPLVSSDTKRRLEKCWLWVANYHREPVAFAPWNHWKLWQYTGDGICEFPRRTHPISVGNIKKAERNIFQGSQRALRSFWQEHSWQPAG